jgi:indolepyruvate ferredoxin oxidoreductase
MPGAFTKNPDMVLPLDRLRATFDRELGTDHTHWLDASALANRLFGGTMPVNVMLLGFAYQKGLLPLSRPALEQAIELNGVAVQSNLEAFAWGRRAAHDLKAVLDLAEPKQVIQFSARRSDSLDELIDDRVKRLTGYQDAAYAQRYRALVERVRLLELTRTPTKQGLALAVGRSYFRVLAYKDEYEVARLYVETGFFDRVATQFDGKYRIAFHLAPPLFARRDPDTGLPRKGRFGSWIIPVLSALSKFKGVRGTPWDPFAHTSDRKMERQLIKDYEQVIEEILLDLSPANHHCAIALISLFERVRGYGHIKAKSISGMNAEKEKLLHEFRNARPLPLPTAA